MQVTVEYAAQIKRAAGRSSDVFTFDGRCTLPVLLDRVVQQHGGDFATILTGGDGNLRPSILLFHGDRQIRPDEPAEFRDGDRLTIMSPISGG